MRRGLRIAALGAVLVAAGLIGYWAIVADPPPEWTGFGYSEGEETTTTTGTDDAGNAETTRKSTEPPKNLWDWLDLLIVGAVLAAGGILLNRSARNRELDIAERNRNQTTLQAYYDKMTDLILTHKLKDEKEGLAGTQHSASHNTCNTQRFRRRAQGIIIEISP